MMVDTTIYGYVADGAIYHPSCLPGGFDPRERDDVAALYYLDDVDPHGASCDACFEPVFEPAEKHDFDAVKRACDYGCMDYCGEGEACNLHLPQPAAVENTRPVTEAETMSLWEVN